MTRFLIRRIGQAILVLFAASIAVFLLFFVGPGPNQVARTFAGRLGTPQRILEIKHALHTTEAGGLFGVTPKEAFYVRIDATLNPFSEQQLGRLHIEIGARPTYPAEFIIVRIGIWPGGSDVSET